MASHIRHVILTVLVIFSTGCAFIPQSLQYQGPPDRPTDMDTYYAKVPYTSYKEYTIGKGSGVTIKRIVIETASGEIVTDFFEHDKKNDSLIFVFPLLGGKNLIPDYFAAYFAKRGYDTAIIHRNDDFKNPKYFDKIEETLRDSVIRDRVTMDFFEKEYQKKVFGSFGISRGAINVAITAAVDKRLQYNVLAMGGSDLVDMFEHARIKKLKVYRDKIMAQKGLTKEQFFADLRQKVKTDPKYLAQYMDARNTLLFLSAFDTTVPIKNGQKLRRLIGRPKTIYLAADHFVTAMYTQMGKIVTLGDQLTLFPLDYIETESLAFYDDKFKDEQFHLKLLPYRLLQLPFRAVSEVREQLL